MEGVVLPVETKEFYELRERVALVADAIAYLRKGQDKQNGYIAELAQSIKDMTRELEVAHKELADRLEKANADLVASNVDLAQRLDEANAKLAVEIARTQYALRPLEFIAGRAGKIILAMATALLIALVIYLVGL
jgi:ribulose 1,5-bisphosphate carboxylase large subunit-like protein